MGSEDLKHGRSIYDLPDQPQFSFRETSELNSLFKTLSALGELEKNGIKIGAARKHIQSLIENSPRINQNPGLSKPPSSQTSRA